MKKAIVQLQKKKSSISTLPNNYIENLNAQIFITAEYECHSLQSVQVTVTAVHIPDPVLIQQH